MRTILFLLTLLVSGFAQAQKSDIYMQSGAYVQGKIIAIGDDYLLVESNKQVQMIERSDIKYVFSDPVSHRSSYNSYQSTSSSRPKAEFKPLNKRFLVDLSGGLYTFMPFSLDLSYTHWIQIKNNWYVGPGLSLDFFRYSMVKFSVNGMKLFQEGETFRSFVDGSVGIGPWPSDLQNNGWFPVEIGPVTQATLGGGVLLDSGFGVGLTCRFGLAVSAYETKEDFNGTGSVIKTSYIQAGPYGKLGFIF